MSLPETPVLQFNGVRKSFHSAGGAVHALRDLSLGVFSRDWLVATGPSGSGKSTFLHLATLLDHPTEGELHFDGQSTNDLTEDSRARLRVSSVGVVFQRFHLFPRRSVLENVQFRFRYLNYDPSRVRAAAFSALQAVGLAHRAKDSVMVLSGGEMQRVAIARALALQPRLLAADEPTGNLDSDSAQRVMECFRRIHQAGTAVLLVTHNPAWIGWGTRHVRFADGRVSE